MAKKQEEPEEDVEQPMALEPDEAKQTLVVEASSAGFCAGDYATIKINDVEVELAPNENKHYRGLHIVLINQANGKVDLAQVFDTYATSIGFEDFIKKGVPAGYIVAAAGKDDCTQQLSWNSRKWFVKMGSKEIWKLRYRQGFAFIGTTGKSKPNEERAVREEDQVSVT